jgi:hypothetical protein
MEISSWLLLLWLDLDYHGRAEPFKGRIGGIQRLRRSGHRRKKPPGFPAANPGSQPNADPQGPSGPRGSSRTSVAGSLASFQSSLYPFLLERGQVPDAAKDKKLVLVHATAAAFKEPFAPDDFGGQKGIRFVEDDEVDPLDAEKILQGLLEGSGKGDKTR